MLRTRRWLMLLLSLVIATSPSACTLINYGIGSAIDAGNKQTYEPAALGSVLEPGTKITVVLLDLSEVKGKYAGLEPEAPEKYAERYAAARAELAPRFALPGLGEPITVTYHSGALLQAELAGFDLGRLVIIADTRHTVRLSDLRELASADCAIAGEALALLLEEGALPLMSGIAIEDAKLADGSREERTRIPLDGVHYITYTPTTARTKWLISGAIVDATVIVLIAVCAGGQCGTASVGAF